MRPDHFKGWLLVALALVGADVYAAPREASKNDAALMKLQAALKAMTAERDAAKAESGKLTGEVEQLRKDHSAAVAAKDQLSGSLDAQRNASQALQGRIQSVEAKLSESAEKNRELTQNKASLTQELTALKAKQQATEQQLQVCGQHNGKLVKSAEDLLEKYQSKGSIASLMQDEPLLQFQSVEMEDIAQQYRDQISSEKLPVTD